MRKDPTIALTRAISAAPVISAEWAVEGTNEEYVEFIEEQLLPIRFELVSTAIYDRIDFGWAAFEQVYEILDREDDDKLYGIEKVKSLLNDNTWALYNDKGDFAGFENKDLYLAGDVVIDAAHSLFVNLEDENVGMYAEPLLANCYEAWRNGIVVNEAAANYDKKISGEHWIIHYPVGTTPCTLEGVNVGADGRASNDEIAAFLLKNLEASGSIAIPVYVNQMIASLDSEEGVTGWKIELLGSSGQQSSFVDRSRYLDTLKVRALLTPERAILEGTHGTKAESEAQIGEALAIKEIQHTAITRQVNKQVVNELLMLNYGEVGDTKLVALPLHDAQKAFYQELFMKLIDNPELGPELLDGVQFDAIRDALDVPVDKVALEERDKVIL